MNEKLTFSQNLDYAKGLLLKLEREALGIKIQSKKIEAQTDLVKKREDLLRLSERLDELMEVGTCSLYDPGAIDADPTCYTVRNCIRQRLL